MSYKVLKVTVKVPKVSTLPDGNYTGEWCGSVVTVRIKETEYELKTEEGIRGRCRVIVYVENGVVTFDEVNN